MRFSGVRVARFWGYAPSGKSVQRLGAAPFRVHEHQVADLWVLGDFNSLDAALAEQVLG